MELCLFFKQICSQTLMEDDMLKAQSKVVDILCNLKLIYPSAFFDIMIYLVIHLPLKALEGGPIHPRMLPQNLIVLAVMWIALPQRVSFRCFDNPEIDTYRAKFKSEFPNQDMKEEFLGWFGLHIRQRHIDKDPSVSASSELFALACGPTQTPISVNSCIVNGVRFIVHNRDEHRTTQNSGICSPGDKDGEILNDLDFETLHIDGQSMDVDAPPDIIEVDEDDDIIDEEDALSYDLADSDDEDLVNDDDDHVAVMLADVARGHSGDGGSDDCPPPHQIGGDCQCKNFWIIARAPENPIWVAGKPAG
ncbi:S-adenosyl-L-methionine-dependent methyltransferases superfamily protein [Tanacetum coccineum]